MSHSRGPSPRLLRAYRACRGLRALARIELRQLRRQSARSWLVVLLIAVPVAALVGVGTLARIAASTPEERAQRTMGDAALRIDLASTLGSLDSVRTLLPAHSVMEEIWEGPERVQFRGRRLRAAGIALSVGNERAPGMAAISPGDTFLHRRGLQGEEGGARALPCVRLLQGRAPSNAGEVALAPSLLRGLECALGDTVSLSYGPSRVITGVAVDPEDLARPVALRVRSAVEHQGRRALLVSSIHSGTATGSGENVETELEDAALRLRERGFRVQTRAEAAGEPDGLASVVSAAAGIGFVEAALVIAAAFGVALRRRQYEIGLVGAVGAESWMTASALVASALALALLGGLLGLAAGLAGAACLHPQLDGWNHRLNGDFEVSLPLLWGALGLGLLSAGSAAALPAWRSAHTPIRVSLSGRRPATASVRGWLLFGCASLAIGLLLLVLASSSGGADASLRPPVSDGGTAPTGRLATSEVPGWRAWFGPLALVLGPVLSLLGFGALSPWLLERVSRIAGKLPLAWRLAVRDAGRYRGRSGAAITAVLAGMSMSTAAAVLVAAIEVSFDALPASLRDDQLLIQGPDAERLAEELSRALPVIASVPLLCVHAQGEPVRVRPSDGPTLPRPSDPRSTTPRPSRDWIACGGSELLRALGVSEIGPATGDPGATTGGSLLRLVTDRELGVRWPQASTGTQPAGEPAGVVHLTVWRSGSVLSTPETRPAWVDQFVIEPRYYLDAARLAELGFEPGPPPSASVVPWLIRLRTPVSSAVLDVARAIAAGSPGTTVDAQRLHERPTRAPYLIALFACMAIGLTVVLIATALSAAESRTERRVARAVGATPRQVRAHHAARAAYLALLGCALSIPSGFATAHALMHVANLPLPFVIPWRDLWIILMGLPALAYAVAWISAPDAGRGVDWSRPDSAAPGTGTRAVMVALAIGVSWTCAAPGTASATAVGAQIGGVASADASHAAEYARRANAGTGTGMEAEIAWEPFIGRAFDGTPLVGELGRVRVPENRRHPTGRTLEIAFVRYRTTNPRPVAPIFFLAGGPGGSGIDLSGPHVTHPQLRLLDHADVIGIDQRGVGLSAPDLGDAAEFTELLPFDEASTRADEEAAFRRTLRRGADAWRARGIDVAAYNSAESADDIDAVRKELGVERITAVGSSYGTHLALAYLRRYPDRVERLFLSKVEGPDHTWKLPGATQDCLEQLHRRVSSDPSWSARVPDLLELVKDLLDTLSVRPVVVPLPATGSIVLGPNDLRRAIAELLGETQTTATIPALLDRCSRGDWVPLAQRATGYRRIEVPIMPVLMDCASGGSRTRMARIEQERLAPRNLLGDALAAPFFPSVCEIFRGQDLGESFREPFSSDVPILLVSGMIDARTPAANAEEIARWFPRSVQVRADNAGHDARELMSEEYRDLVQAFLRGEVVRDMKVTLPPAPLDPSPLEPSRRDPAPLDSVPLKRLPAQAAPSDTASTPRAR